MEERNLFLDLYQCIIPVAWKPAKCLRSGAHHQESKCIDALSRLQCFPITIGLLTSLPYTLDVFKDLRFLTKHRNNKIKDLASLVLSTWRKKLEKQFVEHDKSAAERINKYIQEGMPLKIILKLPKPKTQNPEAEADKVQNKTSLKANDHVPLPTSDSKPNKSMPMMVRKEARDNANPGAVKALKVQNKSFKKISGIHKPKKHNPEAEADKVQIKTSLKANDHVPLPTSDSKPNKNMPMMVRKEARDNANPGAVKALKVQNKSFKKISGIHKPKILITMQKLFVETTVDDQTTKAGDGHHKEIGDTCPKTPDVQLSPRKAVRAAMLKRRFADTILKAQHNKALMDCGDRADPQEKERLKKRQLEEKARMEAEIRDAEAAMRKRERTAARIALQEMERTADIENNQETIQQLENLCGCSLSYSYRKGAQGPHSWISLEQLGLFLKDDIVDDDILDELEEGEVSP